MMERLFLQIKNSGISIGRKPTGLGFLTNGRSDHCDSNDFHRGLQDSIVARQSDHCGREGVTMAEDSDHCG